MQLETVAAGLLWVWSLLAAPADGLASRLVFEAPRIEQPRSAKFELDVRVALGTQALSVRGEGAFVQPDLARLRLSALEEQFEVIAVGQTVYHRGPGDQAWGETALDQAAAELGAGPLGDPLGPDRQAGADDLERALFQVFGEHQLVGESVQGGALTEHYQASLDPRQLEELARVSSESGAQVAQLLGGLSLVLDYYVGREDRYLRGARLVAELQPTVATPGLDRLRLEAELRLSDFDAPIEILPPYGAEPARPAPAQPPVQAPVQMPAGSGR